MSKTDEEKLEDLEHKKLILENKIFRIELKIDKILDSIKNKGIE